MDHKLNDTDLATILQPKWLPNLLHTASDSISVSPVSGVEAVKAVSLSPVFGLSLLFPTLIPWTGQVCLAAGPITGQPWVVWRLRCLPGSAWSGLLSLCFPCFGMTPK